MVSWFGPRMSQLLVALPDADWQRWLMPFARAETSVGKRPCVTSQVTRDSWRTSRSVRCHAYPLPKELP
jgi:hypothetical protein